MVATGSITNSFLREQLTSLVGATFIILGVTATPSTGTTLTGYETTGSMMAGMQVTVGFVNGTSQTEIWVPTGSASGGAFGSGWSLTESGDSYGGYNNPWTFINNGQSIDSLTINAIPGNATFDAIYGAVVTPGSADGWPFDVIYGQAPDGYPFYWDTQPYPYPLPVANPTPYSVPIDISRGDLFGVLSVSWSQGFNGTMQFLADTDSGTSNDPVKPLNPPTPTPTPTPIPTPTPTPIPTPTPTPIPTPTPTPTPPVPPTSNNFNYTINEGQSLSVTLSATDPTAEPLTFFVNGNDIGTDENTSGTRSASLNLGVFPDNGVFNYTLLAENTSGQFSTPVTGTVNVLNVPPTLTHLHLSHKVIYSGQPVYAWLSATDPGADSINFFVNGTTVGSNPKTSGTRWMRVDLGSFTDAGTYTFTAISQDKDGAFSNRKIRKLSVLPEPITPPQAVPESDSLLGILAFCAVGAGTAFKRKRRW